MTQLTKPFFVHVAWGEGDDESRAQALVYMPRNVSDADLHAEARRLANVPDAAVGVRFSDEPIPADPPSFAKRKAEAIQSLVLQADSFTKPFLDPYTEADRQLFRDQESEALAVLRADSEDEAVRATALAPSDATLLMELCDGVYQGVRPMAKSVARKAAALRAVAVATVKYRRHAYAELEKTTDSAELEKTIEGLRAGATSMQAEFMARAKAA